MQKGVCTMEDENNKKETFDDLLEDAPVDLETYDSKSSQDEAYNEAVSNYQNSQPGLFGKLKNTLFASKEERRTRELEKIEKESKGLDKELDYQKKRTALAKKKADIAKFARERRQNSPMGRTFKRIGGFIQEVGKDAKGNPNNPLLNGAGSPGIGSPNRQRDSYGNNMGVRQPQQPQSQMPQAQPFTPFGADPLGEFAVRNPDHPLAQPKKKRTDDDTGLFSGRW